MKLNTKSWQGALVGVGLLVAVASANDDESKPGIVKPGDQFHGKSYNELVSEWTNWLWTEPMATNPAFDLDGRFCDRNQRGKVWFLAGTFLGGVVNRTCEVPAGKAIFVSLGGAFVSFSPEFPVVGDPCLQMATPLEQVRCDVNDDVPVAPNISIEVMLDGVPLKDLFAYRVQSQPGGFKLREGSLLTEFGFPGDRFPAVTDGYFLLLKPLKPGTHALSLRETKPGQSPVGVNYTLIVPQHR